MNGVQCLQNDIYSGDYGDYELEATPAAPPPDPPVRAPVPQDLLRAGGPAMAPAPSPREPIAWRHREGLVIVPEKGVRAEIATIDLRVDVGGIDLSAKGAQVEAKTNLGAPAGLDVPVSAKATFLDAKARLGTRNADGSVGLGGAVGASVFKAEGTIGEATSLTFSVKAISTPGVELSAGFRDANEDGRPEVCVRGGLQALIGFAAGACLELPFRVR